MHSMLRSSIIMANTGKNEIKPTTKKLFSGWSTIVVLYVDEILEKLDDDGFTTQGYGDNSVKGNMTQSFQSCYKLHQKLLKSGILGLVSILQNSSCVIQ